MSSEKSLELLERTRKVMKAEQKLTALLEKVEPWIAAAPGHHSSTIRDHYGNRVRPIPTNMDQVEVILAMARNWASKTSAPAGWDPSAPVIGFATPNPLPHQLRGGALAALQLERATTQKYRESQQRQEEQESKARKLAQEEQAAKQQKQQEMEQKKGGEAADALNPKKRMRPGDETVRRPPPPPQQQRPQQRAPSAEAVTMNLSDSSSEEDDDDDDSD
uniref:Mediator complex subunit 4 n=1 Tax=Entomoneis paludosa TaxID=265537 RepID=A0A7S3DWH2_9STRA|mmetsp:Transcript_6863/g.14323  ORF Transcript_6863/g.14323 Transcript_6863/m.14323 type:complete len:219 (+) Transcript_6863:86-742(+)|eukprot:CAMPEP_0172447360 /NCGR_PEP_ID=MMETSP1065-20121228/6685_1 /TAXON_ID=265537 /ORGANISM="Amphiprora paludosa, Strain CCMP125" /LENGTH=218 /DNA_ID=CAMNT_0013198643 /DNA_START=34 /DNA_END=690 /DNA_ORIENTATION=-